MPIVSGGSGGGSGGTQTLLSTTTLGAPGTIDVSGIAQTYSDLYMVLICAGAEAVATADTLIMLVNNDTAAHYTNDVMRANAAAASGVQALDDTKATLSNSLPTRAGTSLANSFLMFNVWILGYASTTWDKLVLGTGGSCPRDVTSNIVPEHGVNIWLQTTAVSRVTFKGLTTANLVTGSTLRIYGVT